MKKNTLYVHAVVAFSIALAACNPKQSATTSSSTHLHGYDKTNMMENENPCDNFYDYAAGNWMKNNPIPESESRWGTFNILAKQNEDKIGAILEELVKSKNLTKGSPEQLSRDFYLSYLDSTQREFNKSTPILPLFIIVDGMDKKTEFASMASFLRENGAGGLFSHYVTVDAKNSATNILYFSQGGLSLPDRDYYLKSDSTNLNIRSEYVKYVSKMFGLANQNNSDELAKTILQMETDLAQISLSRVEQRDPEKTYNKMSKSEFTKNFDYLDWNSMFKDFPAFEELVVSSPGFYKNLGSIVEKYSLENWKTYFKWHILNSYAGVLSSDFEKASFYFYSTVLRGTKVSKPLKEKAIASVNSNLGESLGQLFVKKHFSPESKATVSLMVEELRTAFKERIELLEWMSPETKIKALEKLKAFNYKIGYPDKWKDYSDVNINSKNLVFNIQNLSQKKYKMMLDKIGQPVDPTEWGMTPQTVNAYYSPTRNEIVFPAAILQAPFFDPKADMAMNYGGIGAVIGHEFSHGFDDKGSKYDAIGNLNNWWTKEDRINFESRTKKIVEQFNRFEVLPSVFINGELTQGENIADLAGLTMAYYALKNVYTDKENKKSPDGFTWEQRFFLSWAHVWAQNISEKELRQRIITDPHSPGEYRVKGPLSNMPEFHNAFGCKPANKLFAPDSTRVILW
jgi:putative endopeptidase